MNVGSEKNTPQKSQEHGRTSERRIEMSPPVASASKVTVQNTRERGIPQLKKSLGKSAGKKHMLKMQAAAEKKEQLRQRRETNKSLIK